MTELIRQNQWLIEQIPVDRQDYVQNLLIKQLINPFDYLLDGKFGKDGYAAKIHEWELRARDESSPKKGAS